MKFTSSKTLRVFMAFVLALGLMPLPAYAAPSDGGGSTDIVAGKSPALTTQGSEQTVGATDEVQAAEWIADLSDTDISTATFFRKTTRTRTRFSRLHMKAPSCKKAPTTE